MKCTTEEFIEKARKVHGDKYDYSKTEYVNYSTKVCIICPKHGEFWKTVRNHLNGQGCQKCSEKIKIDKIKEKSKNLTLTTEQFIQKARKIHGNKYNYDKTNYINKKTKICIICPNHGEFWKLPSNHYNGSGCPICARKNSTNAAKINALKIAESNGNKFIEKARKIHGNKYDYSKTLYKTSSEKIIITCCKCKKDFKQTPHNHLQGEGCPKCAQKSRISKLSSSSKEFIKKAISIHGNKYDYSKVNYKNSYINVCITCPKHGEFWQKPCLHLNNKGCPICSESHGEKEIRIYLEKHKIKYEKEKTFEGLIGVKGFSLRFDFYLPEHNACIEFDGIQHRKWIKGMQTKQQFLDLQEHDRRKNEFCKRNGITLYRIWKENDLYKSSSSSECLTTRSKSGVIIPVSNTTGIPSCSTTI